MAGERPTDWFGHPSLWIAALGVVVNDHLLKERWPGVVTGKLSDLFGMYLVPFVFMAVLTAAARALGAPARNVIVVRRRWISVCFLAVVGLALTKLTVRGGDVYGGFVGLLRGLVRAPAALVADGETYVRPIHVVRDPSDLLAVLALIPATWVAMRMLEPVSDSIDSDRPHQVRVNGIVAGIRAKSDARRPRSAVDRSHAPGEHQLGQPRPRPTRRFLGGCGRGAADA